MNLSKVKFRGRKVSNDVWVEGDLIRKSSRFGGQNHFIYDDNDIEEGEKGTYYLVDASTVELIIEGKTLKQF